jgi:hypothetical protein
VKSPRPWIASAVLAAVALYTLTLAANTTMKSGPRLAHMVFFKLKDSGEKSRAAMIESCQKYLTGHPGTIYVSFGEIAEDVKEPVSDREFDIALHLVFVDKDAAAAYQKSPKHTEFVEKNKASFAKVRVFDSYLAAEAK